MIYKIPEAAYEIPEAIYKSQKHWKGDARGIVGGEEGRVKP